jgi:catechol 2,3-dioxygenase-like lactoylglutathione lyase family enzyme
MVKFVEATPAFAVFDLSRSVDFYCDKCGYSVIASGPGFALLHRDGVALHLWLSNDESWRQRDAEKPIVSGAESFLCGTVSCRIQVTGIGELYEAMKVHDIIHPRAHLKRADYPAEEFAILDPDGNLVTFFEMDEPASQQ